MCGYQVFLESSLRAAIFNKSVCVNAVTDRMHIVIKLADMLCIVLCMHAFVTLGTHFYLRVSELEHQCCIYTIVLYRPSVQGHNDCELLVLP